MSNRSQARLLPGHPVETLDEYQARGGGAGLERAGEEADVMAVLESGELKGKKIGSTWRIPRAAINAYLAG